MGDTPFGFAGDRAAHRGRDGLLRAMRRTGGTFYYPTENNPPNAGPPERTQK